MVLRLPPLVAHLTELAEVAVVDGIGLGRLRVARHRFEALLDAPVVRREIIVPQRASLAAAEQYVHALGRRALDRGDAFGIEAELQHVRRLLRARELGV